MAGRNGLTDALGLAVLLGAATGIRSTAGLALLAATDASPEGSRFRNPKIRAALEAALVGEMAADKAAPLPPRTEPLPWIGRVALGAAAAAVAASWVKSSRLPAAVVGAALAAATAWAATRLRSAADERGTPDLVAALGEDLAVLGLGAAANRVLASAAAPDGIDRDRGA